MTRLSLLKSRVRGPETLVLIISNPAAQRVVAAWPDIYFQKPFKDKEVKKNASYQSVASEVWGEVRENFTIDDLADQADVPVTHCEKIFMRLIRAGLIYPDGSVSQHATDLLTGQVRAVIRGMLPRGKTK